MRGIIFPTYPSNFAKDIPMQTILGPSRSHIVSSLPGSYFGLLGPFGGPLGRTPLKSFMKFSTYFPATPAGGTPKWNFFF